MNIFPRTLLVVAMAAAVAAPAWANDGLYLGYGATVYPDTNTCVQLASETVVITFDLTYPPDTTRSAMCWRVDATLHFRNLGDAVTVQMGFPFGTSEIIYDENPRRSDPGFRTWVDGRETPTVEKSGMPDSALYRPEEVVYAFPVTFLRGEMKTVRHTYHVGGSGSVSGDQEFRYILTTGALWAGRIDSALVQAVFPASVARQIDVVCPPEQRAKRDGDKIVLEWQWRHFKPNFDVILERIPEHVRDFPLDQLAAHADFSQAWWSAGWCRDGWWQDESMKSHEACHARWLCSRILAEYGYPFDDPFVWAQFYEDGKRRPNPDFRETDVRTDVREFVLTVMRNLDWPLRHYPQGTVPLIRDRVLVLPRAGISSCLLSYGASNVSPDSIRVERLLEMAAARDVVGRPGDDLIGDGAGPKAEIDWISGHKVVLVTSVLSDSVAVQVRDSEKAEPWRTIIVPGLRDSLAAVLKCKTFAFRGTGTIRKLDFKNLISAFSLERDADLDSLALSLERVTPSGLSSQSCPCWNMLRLETGRGIIFGALASDGHFTIVLAGGSPTLEAAWHWSDHKTLHETILSSGTEYRITPHVYAVFDRLAQANGVTLQTLDHRSRFR